MDNLGGQDIRNLPELLNNLFVHRVVYQQKRERFPAFVLAAQMHSCDVDAASPEHASDRTNDAGLVIVREKDHVATRHDLERIAVDIHDSWKLVRKHSSGNAMRFQVCLEFDQNEVRKILRRRHTRLLNPDAALFCDVHRVDQVYAFPQNGH